MTSFQERLRVRLISLSQNPIKAIWIACTLISMVYGVLVYAFVWHDNGKPRFERIIKSDGLGYYRYLPDIFITNDIKNLPDDALHFAKVDGHNVNKYYVGTAISMLPFFTAAVIWEKSFGMATDGRSPPFQITVSLAALFYFWFGLFLLGRLLIEQSFPLKWVLVTLFAIAFGTNLLTYSVELPSMSHVYSWFWINAFFYAYTKLIHRNQKKWLMLCAFTFAMIVLIRPVNGLVLLVLPFLAGSTERFIESFKGAITHPWLLPAIILGLFILSFQPIVWYLQAESLWVWSYQSEGFNFLSPQIIEVLVGFRKGWFIYTPLTFIAILGFYYLVRVNRFRFYSGVGFLAVLVYIISSWWNWYYGSSFGQRPFVEYYGFIGFLLVAVYSEVRAKPYRSFLMTLTGLFILLNMIQAYQYRYEILSKTDMNFEKYAFAFLKTDRKYSQSIGGFVEAIPYAANPSLEYTATLGYTSTKATGDGIDLSGAEYGATHDILLQPQMITDRGFYLKLDMKRKEHAQYASDNAMLVVEYKTQANETYGQQYFKLNDYPRTQFGEWHDLEFGIVLTPPDSTSDFIRIFVWNRDRAPFTIGDYQIQLYSIN